MTLLPAGLTAHLSVHLSEASALWSLAYAGHADNRGHRGQGDRFILREVLRFACSHGGGGGMALWTGGAPRTFLPSDAQGGEGREASGAGAEGCHGAVQAGLSPTPSPQGQAGLEGLNG